MDDQGRQWVHALPIGAFNREYGDPWVISEAVVQEMAANFGQRVPQAVLPWNCNHRRGEAAPGWIEGVEARADGLWVQTRWTPGGQELLAGEAYKYVSAEWYWQWQRPSDGAGFRNVLRGCALTNDPFFTELPAIAEAEDGEGEGQRRDAEDAENAENGGDYNGQASVNGQGDGGFTMAQEQEQQATTTTTGMVVPQTGARGGAPGASGAQPGAVGTPPPAAAPVVLTPRPPLPRGEAAREEGEQGSATAGQAGLPAPEVAASGAVSLGVQAVQSAEMAEVRQRLEAVEAENARLRAVNEHAAVLEQVRAISHPADARRHMPPALCEMWADMLCIASNDQANAINIAGAGETPALRTQRQRLLDLVTATAAEWPLLNVDQGGHLRTPEDTSGLNVEEKSVKLHELAQAKAATIAKAEGESENDWYARRVAAALAEKPDLR